MNLIFRFIWMLIRAHLAQGSEAVAGTSVMTFRCWPHDLDINLHMTNSRYNSFMDIGRINFMIRIGGWDKLRRAGMLPVLGSLATRYGRPINPFQAFQVLTRIVSWDDRWLYMEQRIVAGGQTASITLCKTLFVQKGRSVPTDELMQLIGFTSPKPEFTAVLAQYDGLDKQLVA